MQNKKDGFLIKHLFIKYFLFLFLSIKNPLKYELTELLIAPSSYRFVLNYFLKLHYLPFPELELYAHTKLIALYSIETYISRKTLCTKSEAG